MRRMFLWLCTSLPLWTACSEADGLDMDDIEVPAGYALSAGTATNFLSSSFAYDTEADWVSGVYADRKSVV